MFDNPAPSYAILVGALLYVLAVLGARVVDKDRPSYRRREAKIQKRYQTDLRRLVRARSTWFDNRLVTAPGQETELHKTVICCKGFRICKLRLKNGFVGQHIVCGICFRRGGSDSFRGTERVTIFFATLTGAAALAAVLLGSSEDAFGLEAAGAFLFGVLASMMSHALFFFPRLLFKRSGQPVELERVCAV
jgi:hypothetical protein